MTRTFLAGVPPTDPALHRVAFDLAGYQLGEAVRQRTAMIAACVILLGGPALFAVTDRSLWFAVLAVLALGMLVHTLLYPAQQRRRVARLEQACGAPGYPATV